MNKLICDINDMYESLLTETIEQFSLEEIRIFLLLFADDTVLFSYTQDGLQCLINKLHDYCTKWGISVNIDKTVVMVFKKGNRPENLTIKYNNFVLKQVQKFNYLGITLTSNGSFYQTQKALSKQALRALFSLNTLFDNSDLHISEKLKLFDAMIGPILNYSSPVWGFHKAPDIERVHLKFLKQILRVKPQTTNTAVYGELGRVPMQVIRKIQIVKYWFRILQMPESLQYKLLFHRNDDGCFTNKWLTQVNDLINDVGFSFLLQNYSVTKLQLQNIISCIYDQYFQSWFSDLRNSSKLESYNQFKTTFGIEKYLTVINNVQHRIAMTKFRCSAHRLLIEEGRYRNLPRSERICQKCTMNVVENEYHFLLVCPFYRELRLQNLPKYFCHWPNIEKFKSILSCSQRGTIIRLGRFIYLANDLREKSNAL